MAYKFQSGLAILSGSIIQEGDIEGTGDLLAGGGVEALAGNVSASAQVIAGGNISGGGSLTIAGSISGVTTIGASGLASLGSLNIDDGATIGTDSDSDMLTLTNGDKIEVASDLSFVVAAGKLELGDGNAVTATAAEINYLDNDDLVSADIQKLADLTATAAEINYLDNDDLVAGDIQKLADLTATAAEINYLDNDDLAAADIQKLADLTATAAELNIMDGDTAASSVTVADADRVVFNDDGTMKQVAMTDLAAYFDDEITAMPNLISIGSAGSTTNIAAGDLTLFDSNSNANPSFSIGKDASDSLAITSFYEDGDTKIQKVEFKTFSTSNDANAGRFEFAVDEVAEFAIVDGGIQVKPSGRIGVQPDPDIITLAAQSVTLASDVALTYKGTAITSTGAELNFLDGLDDHEYDEAADSVVFFDAVDSQLRYESANDFAGKLAGDGLTNASGQLVVQVSGAVRLTSDKVAISGSIAGEGINYSGGVDSISELKLDLSEISAGGGIQADDEFVGHNAGGSNIKYSTSDLADKFAGAGMTATAGEISVIVGSNSGLNVAENSMSLDLDDLAAADVDLSADSIAIIDSDGSSKKESLEHLMDAMTAGNNSGMSLSPQKELKMDVADLDAVTAIASGDTFAMAQEGEGGDPTKKITIDNLGEKLAGAGLTNTAGVLSVTANDVNVFSGAGALAEGYNIYDGTASVAMTLPEGAQGDVVTVKAGNMDDSAIITINKHGTQNKQMDGEDSTILEGKFSAISFVYANDSLGWRRI